MSMGLGGSYVVTAARRPGRRRGFPSGTPQGLAGFDSTPVAPSPQNAWVDPAESAQGIRRSKGAGKRTIKGKDSLPACGTASSAPRWCAMRRVS